MKKRFLLVLALFVSLTSLYAVLAQEDITERKILGIDLFIVLPTIMILISLIIFFGAHFKNYYRNVVHNFKTDVVNELKMQLGAINRIIAFLSSKLIRRIAHIKPAEKVKKEEKKLVHKGETSLARLKEFRKFFTKKEEAIKKAFKQTQKQVSNQIHNITKPAKTKPSEPIKKGPEQAKESVKIKHELIPHKPPALPPIYAEKKEIKELTNVNTSIEKEQKLQKEKERLFKPPIETPKVKMGIEHLKELQGKEKEIIKKAQKPSRMPKKPIQTPHEKQHLKKYEWEITADKIRRKKTRVMNYLLKEEQDIQSKLKELE